MEKENKRTYNEICEEMEKLSKKRDTEFAHIRADQLLEQALQNLGAKRLVKAYQKISKWYA